jgi:hypothetical protein
MNSILVTSKKETSKLYRSRNGNMQAIPVRDTELGTPSSGTAETDEWAIPLIALPQTYDEQVREYVLTFDTVDDATTHFQNELYTLFEIEPVELGVTHPAETYILKSLQQLGSFVVEEIDKIWEDLKTKNQHFARDLILCLSRLDADIVFDWAYKYVREALQSENVSLRDAAVLAIENWECRDCLSDLKEYISSEKVKWLANYAEKVADDLQKNS